MITGRIDENFEARIEVQILHEDLTEAVEFLVDTGFNGYIAIPLLLVERFDLRLGAVQTGITADGRTGFFDTVEVQIIWHRRPLMLTAQVLDEPLIGTRLLAENELFANWRVGGEFRLTHNE
jgi:clan AA aspartic protease